MESETTSQKGFAQRQLPWLIATGVLLLYLFTLDRWVNYRSLAALIKAVGWDWRPSYVAPLHFLLTYPIRWLPSGWQIVGLNFLSALCAFFTLALLARSVAILPHDRTRDQRQAERSDYSFLTIRAAWLPPLLAALVCGLQLSFWENAIISTGET